MEIDFAQVKRQWDNSACGEEEWLTRPSINRSLRWREVERRLDGVKTILDVGGATGAFSIPLARRGFSVTHLDISTAMLNIARGKAGASEKIRFIEANAADLSQFPDRSFDLVLNMDGPLSSGGAEAERILRESCRVTRKRLIVTAAHRAWMLPALASSSISAAGKILPPVYALLRQGVWRPDESAENAPLPSAPLRAFLPDELGELLRQAGMNVLRASGIGSLASLCESEALEKVLSNETLFEEFLDLCEIFDNEILPGGPGTRDDTGLIAVAERIDLA